MPKPEAPSAEPPLAESASSRPESAGFASLPRDPHHGGPSSDELDANPRFLVLRKFHSAFLPDDRDILVYLPEAYLTDPDRHFPVFYMNDGQNLFDGRTSYITDRTWRAHATADFLTREGKVEPLILVGIDNTGVRRMAEYTPTRDPKFRGGEGDRYGALLTEELKPVIDAAFRTDPAGARTGLGGSSLGGLITLYLGLRYPETFGRLAVLSPSVWWDGCSILAMVGGSRPEPRPRIWLDMGTAEGLRHLHDADLLDQRLQARGWREGRDLRYLRVEGGLHEEGAWAARFGDVLQFLFPA